MIVAITYKQAKCQENTAIEARKQKQTCILSLPVIFVE